MAEVTNFSFMRPEEGDGQQQPVIPVETRRKMAEDERQKYLAFMQHPSYKKRLLMEMYGKEANPGDAEQQKALEQEYGERTKSISEVPIKIKKNLTSAYGYTYPGEENAGGIVLSGTEGMDTNPDLFQDVVRHEFGHAVNNGIVGRGGNDKNPVLDIMTKNSPQGRMAMREIMEPGSSSHVFWNDGEEGRQKAINEAKQEFSPEVVDNIVNIRSAADKEISKNIFNIILGRFKPKVDDWSEFVKILRPNIFDDVYKNPTEAAARLGNIRRLAAEKFGHDMNEDFDVKKYAPQIEKYYEERGVRSPLKDVKQQGFSDEVINEMMKYIARNPSQQQTGRYTG